MPPKKIRGKPRLIAVAGEPSWRLTSDLVDARVTETGGHLGPVIYERRGSRFSPFAPPPWAKEKWDPTLPPMLRILRGDFFCLPFGGNDIPFRGEKHPPHGETANARWTCQSLTSIRGEKTLHLALETKRRRGRLDKFISVREGHNAVYSRHIISRMSGPMSFGHHAIVKFPDQPGSGLISVSPFRWGSVVPESLEHPQNRGYSALVPGARFDTLKRVPTIFGTHADLSSYPARRGYEDIVILASDPALPLAWTAVTFPAQRQVWFALKDPRVLRQTLFWMSNGGRHYPPWNGRHLNTMGLEEVTSYFHYGLSPSVRANPMSAAGCPTSVRLKAGTPFVVNYIMAAAPIPKGFDHVAEIESDEPRGGVALRSVSGKKVFARLDVRFLKEPALSD